MVWVGLFQPIEVPSSHRLISLEEDAFELKLQLFSGSPACRPALQTLDLQASITA